MDSTVQNYFNNQLSQLFTSIVFHYLYAKYFIIHLLIYQLAATLIWSQYIRNFILYMFFFFLNQIQTFTSL